MNRPDIHTVLALDADRRRARELAEGGFNPISGLGACGRRVWTDTPVEGLPRALVPVEMTHDSEYAAAMGDAVAWRRLRCRHDFEYWAATCVRIRHKVTGADVPFVLNAPQRRVAAIMEADRRAARPIRMIMLKARQWGGSTLVQMYMAWIQNCLCRNWHSLICAHVKDAAANIRGMYTKMLSAYPPELWDGDEEPRFRAFERSANIREIAGRGCRVTIGSAENQEAVRGSDYCMAHLSETAFWPDTPKSSPQDFIRAVCGAIALIPNSLIVIESTANGVGSYFHKEWIRCREGRGDKHAVFVPWHEIAIYRMEPDDPAQFAATMTDYEWGLWNAGLCLDQIYWYHRKNIENQDAVMMMAEYPTTDTEAFMNTGRGVFALEAIERLRAGCNIAPRRGEPADTGFAGDSLGRMLLWKAPRPGERYVVSVDVGGRSAGSDWSVIAVMRDARASSDVHEVVAQWRGHTDHDLLVGCAERMARFYNNALLIIESNTLETESAADCNLFVLSRLAGRYHNLYMREGFDTATGTPTRRVGFHTNRATKSLIVAELIEAVRDGAYVERDPCACDEFMTYEQLPNGSFAAKSGCHDDIVITRALAIHALHTTGFSCHGVRIGVPRLSTRHW